MGIVTSLLLLVACARFLGKLATSLGQNQIVGEIAAGLLLGPMMLNQVHASHELQGIVELGIFLLILNAGLEIKFQELIDAIKPKTILIAILCFTIPLASGTFAGLLFDLDKLHSITIGLCMAITALPIVIRILDDNNILDTKLGHQVLGISVLIDILALLALGILFDAKGSTSLTDLLKTISFTSAKILVFFIIVYLINKLFILKAEKTRNLIEKLFESLGEEALFATAVLFVLVFSSFTEYLGLHFIIGAFFGGLLLSKDILGEKLYPQLDKTLQSISGGFLTPVFFAFIGLQLTNEAFEKWRLLIVILLVGYVCKTMSAYFGARLTRSTHNYSLKLGILLNGRGVLDIVVADIGLSQKYITPSTFSMLVILGIASIIVTPIFYKMVDEKEKA